MGRMYILKMGDDSLEWTVVRNESVTSPMPSAIKKFMKFDDVLNWLHEDNEKNPNEKKEE